MSARGRHLAGGMRPTIGMRKCEVCLLQLWSEVSDLVGEVSVSDPMKCGRKFRLLCYDEV